MYHGIITRKEQKERSLEYKQCHSKHQSHQKRVCQGDEKCSKHPFLFPRAQILRYEAGTCGVKCCHHVIDERIRIGGGWIALHDHMAEGVDGCLNTYIGYGKERVLYRGRHSDTKHCWSCIPVNRYILHAQAVAAVCLQEKPDDESRWDVLCYDACDGYSYHSQSAYYYKEQVEHYIDNSWYTQVYERPLCIAHCAQHTVAEIIKRKCRRTAQIYHQICCSTVYKLRLCIHHFKQWLWKSQACH